jgi:glyoxylase-like metal-dependent hydrolase (beta-lactamase superfamily II)
VRRLLSIALGALLASACTQATPERRVVDDAVKALGGKSRIESLHALEFEGGGAQADLGQGRTPDGPLPRFDVTDLRLTIDLEHPRVRLTQTRTANFLYLLPKVQKQYLSLDGDVAFEIGTDGMPVRSSEPVARDRRLDRLHHPISIVRAALEDGAQLGNLRTQEGKQVVEIKTATGDMLMLAVDARTHLPISVTSQRYNINLGDVARETTFGDYQEVDGLKMPMHLTTKVDAYERDAIRVTKYIVNPDVSSMAAPPALASVKAPPAMADPIIDVKQVGEGVWFLGGQSHHSVLVAFADHTVLIEVPQHEVRAMAVIAKAREIVDNKPLMKAIVTHHHFDHIGGIRAAVSEGLTLVAHESSKAFLTRLVKRQHTIYKDAASQNPRALDIETVGDRLTMKDDKQTLELYHADTAHADTMLVAYLPKDRIIVQADLYSPTFAAQHFLPDFLKLIDTHKLKVATHAPIHGPVQTDAEFLSAIRGLRSYN